MDSPLTEQDPGDLAALSWGPPRSAVVFLGVLVLLLGGLTPTVDAAGRLLLIVVAVAALAGAGWLLGGPALRADSEAVVVRGALRTHTLPWSEVRLVAADNRRRSRAVEVETIDGLFAVPGILLGGVSPRLVADRVSALRPTDPPVR